MKKIIYALAILAGAAAVSCIEEPLTGPDLSKIKADNTYVAIDTLGGSSTINITASESWKAMVHTTYEWSEKVDGKTVKHTVDTLITPGTSCNPHAIKDAVESWITVDPLQGSGDAVLTISAPASDSYRTQELRIVGETQTLDVIVAQGVNVAKSYNVNQALQIIRDGKATGSPVIVKGIVCKIDEISTSYGNATYYLSDDGTFSGSDADGNWLEVYRGKWLNGENFTKGDEFAVGDELTIKGVLMLYNGKTPETVQGTAEVLSIKKSLVSVNPAEFKVGKEATDVTVGALYSGDKLTFSIDEKGLEFLSVTGTTELEDTTFFTVHVAENTDAAARTGVISFSSASGSDKSVTTVTVTQEGAAVIATISEIAGFADNTAFLTQEAIVTALTTRGFVASDGTTGIYVYLGKESAIAPALGDRISFAGIKTTYNGVPEVTDVTNYEVASSGNTIVYPTSNNITGNFDSYAADVAEFISFTGKLANADGYYNVTVPGASRIGRLTYPVDALGAADFDGKDVTIKGYYNGINTRDGVDYLNVIATSVAEGGATSYVYKKATAITSGKTYLIAALSGDKAEVMETLAQSGISKTYGYLKALEVAPEGDEIVLESQDYGFTFTASGAGYTIQNSEGKYIYQNGTYKTYNEAEELNENCVWTASFADGAFALTSPGGYTMYYDTGYGSYGVYNETKDTYVMPCLYEYQGVNTETSGPKYAKVASVDALGDAATVLIAAPAGDKFQVMETLAQSGISKTYGYLKALESTADGDVIALESEDFEFTVTKTAKGYTVQNSEGKYIYQNGTYKTYNESAEINDNCYWTVRAEGGAFSFTSPAGYTMYYDTDYSSYGVYNETKDTYVLPCIFKKK